MTVIAVVLGLFLAEASPAPAAHTPSKEEVTEAHNRFQRGTELYQENNLAGALAEFRRAYAIAPNYRILYNIGQLCFLLQDYPCAYESLGRYLGEGGNEVAGSRRDEVQRDLNRLQGRVAKLRIVADKAGAEVVIDNVVVGKTPIAEPVLVTAGRPQIRVSLAGYAPFTRVIEVAGMESSTVDVELLPIGVEPAVQRRGPVADASAPQVLARPGAPTPVAPWVVTGLLALGAGAAGGLALWSSSDLQKERQKFPLPDTDSLSSRSTRTRALALSADVLIGATAIAAGIATYMTFWGSHPASAERVALHIAPGGLVLQGGF
jgi:hypothetical protein